jgi:L-alanine-DL-glutamate epimerase-like enolase superfamily enzyme
VGYASPAERFADDVIREPITFIDGMVHLPQGNGLGVEVDDAKLAKYALSVKVR